MAYDTDVLIAGAGPTGLVVAAQLAARGVSFRIVDKTPERSDKSRALVVHARTLELLAKMNLADELLAHGTQAMRANLYVDGKRAVKLTFGDLGIDETPYPFMLFASQVETERVLDGFLERAGVEIERPTALTGFTQDDEGVDAQLECNGTTEQLRVRYLIGADGAHSVVRHGCDMSFEGEAYSHDFILADAEVDWDLGHDQLHLFLSRHGFFAFFPMLGAKHYRIMGTREENAPEGDEDPTLAELERRMLEHCQTEVKLSNPTWLARFHLHHRGVDRYREGRAFVAGDAAHIHSPAGGQGMNTGMQDAYNLGWKLALVVQNRADPSLLDTYNEERFPVGRKLLRFTDRAFSMGTSENLMISTLRSFILPRVAPIVLSDRGRRARAFRFASQIGIRYRKSALNSETGEFNGGPRAGDRVPDAHLLLADGSETTVLEHLLGTGSHALAFCSDEPAQAFLDGLRQAIGGHDDLIDVVPVISVAEDAPEGALLDEHGETHERFGLEKYGVYLVRPDGHVAFRSSGPDASGLGEYLAAQLRSPKPT